MRLRGITDNQRACNVKQSKRQTRKKKRKKKKGNCNSVNIVMPREWEEEKKKNQWVAKQLTLNPWNQKKHTQQVSTVGGK